MLSDKQEAEEGLFQFLDQSNLMESTREPSVS